MKTDYYIIGSDTPFECLVCGEEMDEKDGYITVSYHDDEGTTQYVHTQCLGGLPDTPFWRGIQELEL